MLFKTKSKFCTTGRPISTRKASPPLAIPNVHDTNQNELTSSVISSCESAAQPLHCFTSTPHEKCKASQNVLSGMVLKWVFCSLSVSSFLLLDHVLCMKLSSENRDHALIGVAKRETSVRDTNRFYWENIILITKAHFCDNNEYMSYWNSNQKEVVLSVSWMLCSLPCQSAWLQPAALASPWSLVQVQNLGPIPDLPN